MCPALPCAIPRHTFYTLLYTRVSEIGAALVFRDVIGRLWRLYFFKVTNYRILFVSYAVLDFILIKQSYIFFLYYSSSCLSTPQNVIDFILSVEYLEI